MGIFNQRGETVVVGTRRSSERDARGGEHRPSHVEVFPRIVTISRQCGAGGADVAARVAAELGFQLWDQELVSHVARKAQTDVQLVRELDERQRDLLDDVLATSIHAGRISGGQYRALLTRTIAELAERGGAVIVGRGANMLVAAEQALRVSVVCPFDQRVQRYGERERLDFDRASSVVRAKDRERERFVAKLAGESSADPTQYDLVVNTLELCERSAARLIVTAYEARFGRQRSAMVGESRELE